MHASPSSVYSLTGLQAYGIEDGTYVFMYDQNDTVVSVQLVEPNTTTTDDPSDYQVVPGEPAIPVTDSTLQDDLGMETPMMNAYLPTDTAPPPTSGGQPVYSLTGLQAYGIEDGTYVFMYDQYDTVVSVQLVEPNTTTTDDPSDYQVVPGEPAIPVTDSTLQDDLGMETPMMNAYLPTDTAPPGGDGGGGGDPVTPEVIVEGNFEPGSYVTFLMPDGSVPTTLTARWLDSDGTQKQASVDGNKVYVNGTSQGLTLSVTVSNGDGTFDFMQVVPVEPAAWLDTAGSHQAVGEQGLNVVSFFDGDGDPEGEIAWYSRPYWAYESDSGIFTSTPEIRYLNLEIGADELPVDPRLELSTANAEFRINDGINTQYLSAAYYDTESVHSFSASTEHLTFAIGADGYTAEFDIQLVIDGELVGEARTLTVHFDHLAPQGRIHVMDDADISGFDTLETAALFTELDLAGTAVFVDFSEGVRSGGGWAASFNPGGTPASAHVSSWLNSPTGDVASAVWVRISEGSSFHGSDPGEWVNFSAVEWTGDYLFDAAIVVSDAEDAEFVFKRPVNVHDVTASPAEVTATTFDQDFVITGTHWPGVLRLEGDVFEIDAYRLTDYGVPALDSANLTWSNVLFNELTGVFEATVTFHAEAVAGLTSEQIANIGAHVTAQSISQTIVDTTSTMLVDRAGNLFDGNITDPTVVITPTSLTGVLYEPATGTGGRDNLDLTALGGGTEVQVEYASVYSGTDVFLIADFSIYGLSGGGNWFEGGDSKGHEVDLAGSGAGNSIAGGVWTNDTVSYESVAYDVSGVSVNLSATPVTNGGDTRDWIEVTRAEGSDYITGIEFFVGSNADDTISGTAGFEILAGNDGDDVVTGNGSASAATGGDLLVGGSGVTDTLIGSSGVVDILVDIDGGTLQGRETPWQSGDSQSESDHDVFVVRDSATINNFALSSDQAHLSGRSNFAADRITFALNTTAVVMAALDYYSPGHGLYATDPQFLITAEVEAWTKQFVKERLSIEQSVVGNDLVLTLTDGFTDWGDVTLAGVAATLGANGDGAQVIRLDKYEASQFDTIDYAAIKLSATETGGQAQMVAENVIRDFLEHDLLSGEEIHVPIALESVIAGTIGDTAPGRVMAASLGLLDTESREFVPGYADQDLLGGLGNDRYKFVVQNFSEESGGVAGDAGRDTVLDVGGADNVWLGAATIADITVEAFRAGREQSANSLRIDYEQHGADGLTNQGSIQWLGAFRDGGRTALETITVSGGDTNADGVVDQDDELVSYSVARADYDLAVFDGSASFDPTVPETIVAGRSFVVDTSGDTNWIVAGNRGDVDILRISGVQATGEVSDVRIWGFEAGDVVDISQWLADNAVYFADLPTGPITNATEHEIWSSSLDDNGVFTDTAHEKSLAIFSDAVEGDTPVHLTTIYFMDLEESLDSVVLYAG